MSAKENDYLFGSIQKIELGADDEFLTSAVMAAQEQALEQNK